MASRSAANAPSPISAQVYVGGTIGTQYTGIPVGPGAQLTLQGTAVTLVGITSTGTSVVVAGLASVASVV